MPTDRPSGRARRLDAHRPGAHRAAVPVATIATRRPSWSVRRSLTAWPEAHRIGRSPLAVRVVRATLAVRAVRVMLALHRVTDGGDRRQRERGDVPGWVLITLMTAGLVTTIWALAGTQLAELFTQAISSVTGPGRP